MKSKLSHSSVIFVSRYTYKVLSCHFHLNIHQLPHPSIVKCDNVGVRYFHQPEFVCDDILAVKGCENVLE